MQNMIVRSLMRMVPDDMIEAAVKEGMPAMLDQLCEWMKARGGQLEPGEEVELIMRPRDGSTWLGLQVADANGNRKRFLGAIDMKAYIAAADVKGFAKNLRIGIGEMEKVNKQLTKLQDRVSKGKITGAELEEEKKELFARSATIRKAALQVPFLKFDLDDDIRSIMLPGDQLNALPPAAPQLPEHGKDNSNPGSEAGA